MADEYINAQDLTEDTSLDGEEQFVMFDSTMGKRAKLKNIKTYMNADVAQPDGYYPELTAGNADVSAVATALAGGSYTEESVPYKFRHTGGDVTAGGAEEDCIVGGTIAWNQRVQKRVNSDTSTTYNGLTITLKADGSIVLNGTVTSDFWLTQAVNSNVAAVSNTTNHKILVVFNSSHNFRGYQLGLSMQAYIIANDYNACVVESAFRDDSQVQLQFGTDDSFNNDVVYPMLFDLTQMFGSAVADYIYNLEQSSAGKGVAFFRNMFPEAYYEYNAGELKSVSGLSAHVTTGFNLWDEEWDIGDIDGITGEYKSGLCLRSKSLIPVFPNTQYYFKFPSGFVLYEYDGNRKAIINNGQYAYHEYTSSRTYTTSANTRYVAFRNSVYVASQTYNHDICINLSGDRNGEYEPYKKHSYALDSSLTLRGVPQLVNNKVCFDGDEYRADGSVTRRYGTITFDGNQSWGTNGDKGVYKMISQISPKPKPYGHLFTTKYVAIGAGQAPESSGYMNFNDSGSAIQINDANAMTDTAFMQMLASNPLTLVYELETPTAETASAYVNPQACDEYGTEKYVSTSLVPVGHKTKYYDNLTKRIDKLPSAIAPLEKSATSSANYSVGDYLILNNTLYKVTSAISAGGTITAGSNVTATTIMAEIKALQ